MNLSANKHISWFCEDILKQNSDALCYVTQHVGIDLIHIRLPWAHVEALPGKFDFTSYAEKLSYLSKTNGSRFIVSLDSSRLPSWLQTETSEDIFARDFDGNTIPELDIFDESHVPYLLRFYEQTLNFLTAIDPGMIYAAFPAITAELELKFGQVNFRWRSFTDAAQRRFHEFMTDARNSPQLPVPRFNNSLSDPLPRHLEFFSAFMNFRELSLLAYVRQLCEKIRHHNIKTFGYFGEFFTLHDAIYGAGVVERGQSEFDFACINFNFYNGFTLMPDAWVTPVLVNYARNLGYSSIWVGLYLERYYSSADTLNESILSVVAQTLDQIDDGEDIVGLEIGGLKIGDASALRRHGIPKHRDLRWGGNLRNPFPGAIKIAVLASFDNHYLWHGDFSCDREHLHDILCETYRILRLSREFDVSLLSARMVGQGTQSLAGFDAIFLPHTLAMDDGLIDRLVDAKRAGVKIIQDVGAGDFTPDGLPRNLERLYDLFGLTEMVWCRQPGRFYHRGRVIPIDVAAPEQQYFTYVRLAVGAGGTIEAPEFENERVGLIACHENALTFGFLPQLCTSVPGKSFWETFFIDTIEQFVRGQAICVSKSQAASEMPKDVFGARVFVLKCLRRAPFIRPLWDEFERMLAARDQALRDRDAAMVGRDVARAERDAALARANAHSHAAEPEHNHAIEAGAPVSSQGWMDRVFDLAKPYVTEGVLEPPVCIAATLGNTLSNGPWFDDNPALLATTLEALERDQLPIPTTSNREGYGHGDHAAYWLSGYQDYVKVRAAAERLKVKAKRVLDFGGSTGRVYRHFYAQGWAKEVYVCDFKQVTIEWCKLNFPADIRVCLNTFLPSLPFPDEFFDLITAFSVFTHIDEFEDAWLLELSRILRPGGLAYLTIHDENTWTSGALANTISQSPQASAMNLDAPMPFERRAFTFRRDSHYACNVFHNSKYIRKYWGRYFQIESIEPFGHHAQAVVLARKPISPPVARLGQETVVPEAQSDLAAAAAIWNQAAEPLEQINQRIHDGVPLDKLAERADTYVNNIMHLFPHAFLPPDASILEIGSGVGYIMEAVDRYARSNNLAIKQIVGLDIAEHMIEKAKSRVGENSNFAFVHYDGIDVPLPDGSFDLIYSVASLQHVPKPYVYNLFFEIRRLLAESGHAVIQLLNFKGPTSETWRDEVRQQVRRSPGHWHHCYTVEELEFAVRASGFSHIDIREVGGLTWVLARSATPPLPLADVRPL